MGRSDRDETRDTTRGNQGLSAKTFNCSSGNVDRDEEEGHCATLSQGKGRNDNMNRKNELALFW